MNVGVSKCLIGFGLTCVAAAMNAYIGVPFFALACIIAGWDLHRDLHPAVPARSGDGE